MSATTARVLPVRSDDRHRRDQGPRPVTTTSSRARPRTAYALVAVGALAVIVVAQLLLSIATSQGAYRLADLQVQKTSLDRASQQVSEDLNRLRSPQNLAMNANALGMVANSSPVYLKLSTGTLVGAPTTAGGASLAAGQNLVANSLLTGMPTVTDAGRQPAPASGVAIPADGAIEQATPGTAAAATKAGPVPWQGPLPSPTTR